MVCFVRTHGHRIPWCPWALTKHSIQFSTSSLHPLVLIYILRKHTIYLFTSALQRKTELGIFRLGSFASYLSLRIVRLVTLAWDISFGNFRLDILPWELLLGNFRLGTLA